MEFLTSFLRYDISIQTRNFCSSCVESVKVLVGKTFPLAGKSVHQDSMKEQHQGLSCSLLQQSTVTISILKFTLLTSIHKGMKTGLIHTGCAKFKSLLFVQFKTSSSVKHEENKYASETKIPSPQ